MSNLSIYLLLDTSLCVPCGINIFCILRRIVLDINLSLHLLTAWILLVCYKSIYGNILFYLLLFLCIYYVRTGYKKKLFLLSFI
jgi:hypothetical protein